MSSYQYLARSVLAFFGLALPAVVQVGFAFGQTARVVAPADPKPTVKKLGEKDAKPVAELEKTIEERRRAGKFAEAVEPAKEVLAICERALGKEHWKTRDARGDVATLMHIAGLPEEGRRAMASVGSLKDKRTTATKDNRYAEAERLSQDLLVIHRRWLGEVHPETANEYGQLAHCLFRVGKFAEAESLDRKALAIQVETLGEVHPETASTCHNLAFTLNEQGKHAEAEPLHRRALRIHLQTVGEDDPETAIVYNIFGRNLETQGNYAAAEPMFRRALAIRLKMLPAGHPSTATSFYNLALVLLEQGKFAESEPMCREALTLRLKPTCPPSFRAT
jgi:tetratricopeptide (TPR) repeat protein